MSKNDIMNSYEELLVYFEEIRISLDLLHDYLNCMPVFNNTESYFDLIGQHGPNFALLNLVMNRMDNLINEHRTVIDNHTKGSI